MGEIYGTGMTADELGALGYSYSDILQMQMTGEQLSQGSSGGSGGGSTIGGIVTGVFTGLQKAGVFGTPAQNVALGIPPAGYQYSAGGTLVPTTTFGAGLSGTLILIALGAVVIAMVVHFGGR